MILKTTFFYLKDFIFEGEVKPLGGDQLIEAIYQDALKWAEKNKERYDSATVNSYLKEQKIYQVPIGQFLNISSPDIANGFVFFNILNIRNNPAILKNFAKNFDYQTRRFKPEFLDQYKNAVQETDMTLEVTFDKLSDNKTKLGSFSKLISINVFKSSAARMRIDPIANPSELKVPIRHELQHGTQEVNSICLAYARKLKDPKVTDISAIREITNTESAKGSYGVGSTVTGLQQGDNAEKSVAKYSADPQGDKAMQELLNSLGNDPELIAYLGDDVEYTTWKSDTLDQIINNFVKKYARFINPKIMAINTKELGNLFSNPKAYQTYNPEQREFVQSYIASPVRKQLKENLHILSREPTSISDLASLIMKDFLVMPSELTKNPSTDAFVKAMMSLKPKEFVRNMTIDLTRRLKNYASEIGAKQASGAEQTTTQQRGTGRSEVSRQQSQQNIQNQQAAVARQNLAAQQKRQAAGHQQQLEQQFRIEKNIVPRNPRKHQPEDSFDDNTGQRILEPEDYRKQFADWNASRQQPTVQSESIKISQLLYW